MPDLTFQVTGVKAADRGMSPLLMFELEVSNKPENERIQGSLVQVQIQFQCPQRVYSNSEKVKLIELFGSPERWGQTLRNRLWTHATLSLRPFMGKTMANLAVPCTFDLNISATKYLDALEQGEVPLLFLFSGTVFYSASDGRMLVQRISWETECKWRMPVRTWCGLMEQLWPNTAWLTLHRDVFKRLCAFKRASGFATWEQTLEQLLDGAEVSKTAIVR